MKLFRIGRGFANDDCGAVTVDLVVLTSAMVGLGIAIASSIGGAANDLGGKVSSKMVLVTITLQ